MAPFSRLKPDVLSLVFQNLDVKDKGKAAQVSKTWRKAAYKKCLWKGVEAKLNPRRGNYAAVFKSLEFRGISKVQVLSLRCNIKKVFRAIPNLESLNLSGCLALSHGLKRVSSFLPNITVLNLSLCKQITDCSIQKIAAYMDNLEFFDLSGCSNITCKGLLYIAGYLHKLKGLDLSSCQKICDFGIGYLASYSMEVSDRLLTLEVLGLQNCPFLTDDSLRYISTRFANLKSLDLSFCTGFGDKGLKNLKAMHYLEVLKLSCCNVSDMGVSYLAAGNPGLRVLDLNFCNNIGDRGLFDISQGLVNLTSLKLNLCPITDEGISRIAPTLPALQLLSIAQCTRVTDRSLSLIEKNLRNLHCIDVYGCPYLSSHGIASLEKLPQLEILNLEICPDREWIKERPLKIPVCELHVRSENECLEQ